jgi:hypothetical protein
MFDPVASPAKMYFSSRWKCLKTEIPGEGVYDAAQSVHLGMLSFFEEIYDACGLAGPAELNVQLQSL